jgi:hypothetical protein
MILLLLSARQRVGISFFGSDTKPHLTQYDSMPGRDVAQAL